MIFKILAATALTLAAGAAMATTTPTGVTGSSAPFSQYQPSLVLNQLVTTTGIFPVQGNGGTAEFLGMIRSFAGNYQAFSAPSARGQTRSTSQDAILFAVLDGQFGYDGPTFNLPDLTGRVVVGAGRAPDAPYVVGQSAGAGSTVLAVGNLPAHDHIVAGGATSTTGGGGTFDNRQPSLVLTQMIAITGEFPTTQVSTGHVMLGEIGQFASDYAPSGWLEADGRLMSVSANQALFYILGTTYGGDGVSTFALPDLRGRTAVGVGQGLGLAAVALGEQFGSASTTLTIAEMPAHDHTIPDGGTTGETGGGAAFDNYQSSLGLSYIISLSGDFPPNNDDGNGALPSYTPFLGEVMAFAGGFAPAGWAFADGQLLTIRSNPVLFAILGTYYGGDGFTDFALPDLRGRSIIGSGTGFDFGTQFGSPTTTLTVANLADHDHQITDPVIPPLAAVPEPATWSLMISGFGLIGVSLRRRARVTG